MSKEYAQALAAIGGASGPIFPHSLHFFAIQVLRTLNGEATQLEIQECAQILRMLNLAQVHKALLALSKARCITRYLSGTTDLRGDPLVSWRLTPHGDRLGKILEPWGDILYPTPRQPATVQNGHLALLTIFEAQRCVTLEEASNALEVFPPTVNRLCRQLAASPHYLKHHLHADAPRGTLPYVLIGHGLHVLQLARAVIESGQTGGQQPNAERIAAPDHHPVPPRLQ